MYINNRSCTVDTRVGAKEEKERLDSPQLTLDLDPSWTSHE